MPRRGYFTTEGDSERPLFDESALITLERAAWTALEKRPELTPDEEQQADDANLEFHQRRRGEPPAGNANFARLRSAQMSLFCSCRLCESPCSLMQTGRISKYKEAG